MAKDEYKNTKYMYEIGTTGLNYSLDGSVHEEFLSTLKGQSGIKIYKEMSSNDPVIGAILYIIRQLVRKVEWRVEPGGDSEEAKEKAEFLESCKDDMETPWSDVVSEILSMCIYGWSYHEVIYKKRKGRSKNPRFKSEFNDSRIGWRKMPIRAQDTLHGWVFDESGNGDVIGMKQLAPPYYKEKIIPMSKALLFRTESIKNNPEGRSLLRNAYRPWFFKKRIEEIEGIGIERDLAGLPVLKVPNAWDIFDTSNPDSVAMKNLAETLVRNIRRDRMEGIVLPEDWELDLISSGGERSFSTNDIINRYNQQIAMTLLSDIIMMGSNQVGSFALADIKKSLLAAAIETILQSIVEVFNRIEIPRLFELNTFSEGELPYFVTDEVETPDIEALSKYITSLSNAGMQLFPDERTENYLRTLASMPEKKIDDGAEWSPEVQAQMTAPYPLENVKQKGEVMERPPQTQTQSQKDGED